MCKQYIYYSMCNTSYCETVLGEKRRNSYCHEALAARRLGHCTPGLQLGRYFHIHDTKVRCEECKVRSSYPGLHYWPTDPDAPSAYQLFKEADAKWSEGGHYEFCMTMVAPMLPKKGGKRDLVLFERVIEASLAEQEEEFNNRGKQPVDQQKKKPGKATEKPKRGRASKKKEETPEVEEKEEKEEEQGEELFVVESPKKRVILRATGTRRGGSKAQGRESDGKPCAQLNHDDDRYPYGFGAPPPTDESK
ncbi:hypothetical protein F4677DRAFT_464269 [Hypoxylon crocopeplum]|nr:hypothetical protein F4677DRAFT_464269 [Hypoxylon crocopeplum]